MPDRSQVVIVGAGPYGLSSAAHLKAAGVRLRIFGSPMSTWRNQMPTGMYLKSDGFASNLSDPLSSFTLEHYCQEQQIAYDHTKIPVRLETFIAYGLEFQRRLVPDLEDKQVTAIRRDADGFSITLDDGEVVGADQVVLAVGITHFANLPAELGQMPPNLVSHSSTHRDPEELRGQDVTILGRGASALDLAALLRESGANVTLLTRSPEIHFHNPPGNGPRSLWQRLRRPQTGIGPGLRSYFYTSAPQLFRRLPRALRHKIVRTHLRPAAGWPMKDRVMGKVPLLLGYSIVGAEAEGARVRLDLRGMDGARKQHTTGHVIAATGYRARLDRLSFLSEEIRSQINAEGHTPILSSDFQSSVPGLYFVGLAAANTFGPMLRFAYGSDYTARHLTGHLLTRLQPQNNVESQDGKLKYEISTH